MKAGKHLQMGGVGAALFASVTLAGAPVAFDAGVVRNAPGLEPKPFAAENGALTFAWEPKASAYIELAFQKPVTLPRFANARVGMKFRAPAGSPVGRMGLRLLYAKGETFQ